MTLSFVNGGVHGEVSALPDRVHGLVPESGLNGIAFVDFDYASGSPGHSTYCVEGLQIGTCRARPQTRLTFAGEGWGETSQTLTAVGNAFVLRGPGHVGRVTWTGGYKARLLSLTPSAVERMIQAPLSRIRTPPVVCDLAERLRVFHLLAALGQDQACETRADPLYVESVALAVIRASGAYVDAPSRKVPTLSAEQAARLRNLVATRIAEPLSLRAMAEAVDLSEGYFVRAFRGSFGVTPYQYVLRERVALAQSLIRSGAASLSEAAALSGFPDARRMGRTFRQVTGCSPTGATRTKRPR